MQHAARGGAYKSGPAPDAKLARPGCVPTSLLADGATLEVGGVIRFSTAMCWRKWSSLGLRRSHRCRISCGAVAQHTRAATGPSDRSLTALRGPPILDRIRTICHSLRVRLIAAVLLAPLLVLAVATGGVGLRCRLTGEVLAACCCHSDSDAAANAESVATVSPAADCCDRLVRSVTAAPATLSVATRALPDHFTRVAVIAFVDATADVDPSALSPRWETRASIGPPTVRLRLVAKSSFLI